MIDPGIAAPLAMAAVIAVVVVVFLHRASTNLAASRRDERTRDHALALWERADAALRILEDRARSLRDERGPGASQGCSDLDAATEELRQVAVDVARAGASPGASGLGVEISRALAGAEQVSRGCRGEPSEDGRRAIKHGFIEVVHAREAVVAMLAELASPADDSAGAIGDGKG